MKFNGRNCFISEKATLGENVRIGDNSTIYDNVTIGDNSTIANDCIIGEPQAAYYSDKLYRNPPTEIGPDSLIRSHSIIYSGAKIGAHFNTGHRITIRENSVIGHHSRIGTNTDIQDRVNIGSYCWLHSGIFIPSGVILEDFVFIYPHVVFTNDKNPPSATLTGAIVRKYAQVGAAALIMPGIEIGENALVGASSVVTRNVEKFTCVSGNPASFKKNLPHFPGSENENGSYPWMYFFERGMPWEGIGYEKWKAALIE